MARLLPFLIIAAALFAGHASADQTINNMGAGGAVSGTDLFPAYQGANPATKVTADQIKAYIAPAAGGVSSINSSSGTFTTGGGISANQPWSAPGFAPWDPYNSTNNTLTSITGTENGLRNSSFTSFEHFKFLTANNPAVTPYHLGTASFTATIDNCTPSCGSGSAGTLLNVASAPTGNIQLFQRVTDGITTTTTAPTNIVAGNAGTPTTCINQPTTCSLQVTSSAGVAVGMYVTDVTNPRAIAGYITVAAVPDGTHVTLNHSVGWFDNVNQDSYTTPGVSTSDTILFATVQRGTEIISDNAGIAGGCGPTPSYPCTYTVSKSQLVASETMQSAGGWPTEGIYMIPVGAASASTNYVNCLQNGSQSPGGNFAPDMINCTVTGTLSDVIIRFPMDYVDSSRFTCSLGTGPTYNCVSSNEIIQPVTFQLMITFASAMTEAPWLDSMIACPLTGASHPIAGSNDCSDNWTTATTDLWVPTLPICNGGGATPYTCDYAYSWLPTGIQGAMAIEFHMGAVPNGKNFIIDGFDLKRTPGVTCKDSTPSTIPCLQLYPAPLELANPSLDRLRNQRFAQLIGNSALAGGWNPGNLGGIDTTVGFANSTTEFVSTWPLHTAMRCNWWDTAQSIIVCPKPNVYFPEDATTINRYAFHPAGGGSPTTTALAVKNIGADSLQVSATSSGLTTGTVGWVTWRDMILLDSAPIGP